MKYLYIIGGIIAALIVGLLVFRRNNNPFASGTDDEPNTTNNGSNNYRWGLDFGSDFGFGVNRQPGEPFTNWWSRRNAEDWSFKTHIV